MIHNNSGFGFSVLVICDYQRLKWRKNAGTQGSFGQVLLPKGMDIPLTKYRWQIRFFSGAAKTVGQFKHMFETSFSRTNYYLPNSMY